MYLLGAVHILRNTKIGIFDPPSPPYVTDLVKILINLYKGYSIWKVSGGGVLCAFKKMPRVVWE